MTFFGCDIYISTKKNGEAFYLAKIESQSGRYKYSDPVFLPLLTAFDFGLLGLSEQPPEHRDQEDPDESGGHGGAEHEEGDHVQQEVLVEGHPDAAGAQVVRAAVPHHVLRPPHRLLGGLLRPVLEGGAHLAGPLQIPARGETEWRR